MYQITNKDNNLNTLLENNFSKNLKTLYIII